MDALRRPAPCAGDLPHPARSVVAGFQQVLVPVGQLLHAPRQHHPPFLQAFLLQLLLGLDQGQAQLVAEIQPVAAASPQEVQDLIPGHAAGPAHEAPRRVELVELVPEDQAALLEQVVRVVQVAHQRIDVAQELTLMCAGTRRTRPSGRSSSPDAPLASGRNSAAVPERSYTGSPPRGRQTAADPALLDVSAGRPVCNPPDREKTGGVRRPASIILPKPVEGKEFGRRAGPRSRRSRPKNDRSVNFPVTSRRLPRIQDGRCPGPFPWIAPPHCPHPLM